MALPRKSVLLFAVLAFQTLAYSQAATTPVAGHSATLSLISETTSAINSSTPLSQRVVAYKIEAKYDPKTHSLDGTELLTYHNLTGQPLDHFPFHLYLNGFQPKATWIPKPRPWAPGTSPTRSGKTRITVRRRSKASKLWAKAISSRNSSSFNRRMGTRTTRPWCRLSSPKP